VTARKPPTRAPRAARRPTGSSRSPARAAASTVAGVQPRAPEPRTKVFVYGTLLSGEPNHHRHLASARLLGEARTPPEFTLYHLGFYPGLVRVGHHAVVGEVYEVDEPTLAALDYLESHPRFYVRTAIRLASGDEVEAYLLTVEQVAGRSVIASGNWRERG